MKNNNKNNKKIANVGDIYPNDRKINGWVVVLEDKEPYECATKFEAKTLSYLAKLMKNSQ